MKCYQAKANELQATWYVIAATEMVVGRLAAQIAPILMGKHRPTYTPHIDTGDYVIVTNVEKVVFTGNKWQQKMYQWYTGHPGGQKEEAAWKLHQRHPDRILRLAIQRMMPKSKMGRHMMAKLKLYSGPQHPHQAQAPIPLEALSGRPTPSGAIYRAEPAPKAPRTPRDTKAVETVEQPQAVAVAHDEPQTPPPTITETAMHEPTLPDDAPAAPAPAQDEPQAPPAES
jgi:large subunit ribosomal protein L13